jgi:DnaJ like chaperone protein
MNYSEGIAFSVVKADGRVSEDEIQSARKIMAQLELDAQYQQEAIQLFTQGKEHQFNLEEVLFELYTVCKRHPDVLRFFIELQVEAALIQGELNQEKQKLLKQICRQLQFSPDAFEHLRKQYWAGQAFHQWYADFVHTQQAHQQQYQQHSYQTPPPRRPAHTEQDAYGVLGVSPSATPAEIKQAYRKLMNQHHPDKLASRGLPESMVKRAKEKTQTIRAAYDLIREMRGFR